MGIPNLLFIFFKYPRTINLDLRSNSDTGSSIKRTDGNLANALAIEIFCASPPDNCIGYL